MASQIAHIVYAKKFLENDHPNWIDKDQFILGCVFPDIRRIDSTISRKDTHMHFSKVDLDFDGLTSFEAGWKFHLYCDMKREEILRNYDFYSCSGAEEFCGQSAKLLEDELLYDAYNNWEKLVNLFNNVPSFENSLDVSHETFGVWYAIIAQYLKEKPAEKTIHIFLSKQKEWVKYADEVLKVTQKLRMNKKSIEILGKVYEEII